MATGVRGCAVCADRQRLSINENVLEVNSKNQSARRVRPCVGLNREADGGMVPAQVCDNAARAAPTTAGHHHQLPRHPAGCRRVHLLMLLNTHAAAWWAGWRAGNHRVWAQPQRRSLPEPCPCVKRIACGMATPARSAPVCPASVAGRAVQRCCRSGSAGIASFGGATSSRPSMPTAPASPASCPSWAGM